MARKKQIIKLTDAFSSSQQVARIIKSLDFSENWEVEIRPATEKRSINQNDLFWMWMDKLAKYFSKEDKKFTKDDIKDIVSHKFLGYESRLIGNTQIKDQLKSTRDLDKESFYFFMTQIDEWALGLGCMLPSPEDSQYRKLKEKNEGE